MISGSSSAMPARVVSTAAVRSSAIIDTTGARLELDDPLFTAGLLHN